MGKALSGGEARARFLKIAKALRGDAACPHQPSHAASGILDERATVPRTAFPTSRAVRASTLVTRLALGLTVRNAAIHPQSIVRPISPRCSRFPRRGRVIQLNGCTFTASSRLTQ